jgi:hypothetical protein
VQLLSGIGTLRSLDVSRNGLTPVGVEALGGNTSLRRLNLRHNRGIGPAGAVPLAQQGHLEEVVAEGCNLGTPGVLLLANAPFKSLDVRNNQVDVQGRAALAQLGHPNLRF